MTTRAAALLDVNKVRGAIRAGMAADLVATPVNPLRDIDGLKKINFVMKDGQLYRTP
jgi:imidazolonepropionase-like amidohydrolase